MSFNFFYYFLFSHKTGQNCGELSESSDFIAKWKLSAPINCDPQSHYEADITSICLLENYYNSKSELSFCVRVSLRRKNVQTVFFSLSVFLKTSSKKGKKRKAQKLKNNIGKVSSTLQAQNTLPKMTPFSFSRPQNSSELNQGKASLPFLVKWNILCGRMAREKALALHTLRPWV